MQNEVSQLWVFFENTSPFLSVNFSFLLALYQFTFVISCQYFVVNSLPSPSCLRNLASNFVSFPIFGVNVWNSGPSLGYESTDHLLTSPPPFFGAARPRWFLITRICVLNPMLHSIVYTPMLSTSERVAEWSRRLTRNPKVRTAVGSNPTLDSLVAVRNTSPGRPEPCEGNLVAVAGSCGGLMVKHPWPLLEISLSDFRGLATLNINTYLPT